MTLLLSYHFLSWALSLARFNYDVGCADRASIALS
jgi:hypothetical protein